MKKTIILLSLITILISCQKTEDKLVGQWDVFLVGFVSNSNNFEFKNKFINNITISKINRLYVYNGELECNNILFDGEEISFSVHEKIGSPNIYYFKLRLNKNSDFLNGECSIFDYETESVNTFLIKCKKIK